MEFMNRSLFQDRRDAGKKLGQFIKKEHLKNLVILALPRGGVVVADEVAKELESPLDVVMVRKIGAPGHPEYGIGAISEDKIPSFNSAVAGMFDPASPEIQETIREETEELDRRVQLYRDGHELPPVQGKTVIVIDDGLATGGTATAAARFLRSLKPSELILAVPVGPVGLSQDIVKSYDRIICLHTLSNFRGVGLWYDDFTQVEDDEVLKILEKYH